MMTDTTHVLRLVPLALFLGLLMVPPAGAQSADQIAERLHAKYASLQTLRAEFTQTMTSEHSDIHEQKSGTLLLRGDDYRLDTGDDIYARRDNEMWRYSRVENQVIVSDYYEDESSFSVNDLFFRYDELFDITDVRSESYEGSRHFRMALAPRQEGSFFREVTLWLRDRDDIVTRVRIVDLNGTVMDFRLRNVELNAALAAADFAPPAGADVVNLR